MVAKESWQQYIVLMQNAKNFKMSTEKAASKYLHGIWRLDKRAPIGGGHYVHADWGDDVTVICTDEELDKTIFNNNEAGVVESVDRIEKAVLDPDGSLKVNGREQFRPLDDVHMAVLGYDFIAVVQRIPCESLVPTKSRQGQVNDQ